MNKMNRNFTAPNGMVQVPEAMVAQMYADIHELVNMHRELISLYEEESDLKKRHRAYLHVRDHAEDLCKADKLRVAEIYKHYANAHKESSEDEDQGIVGMILVPVGDMSDSCEACNEKDSCSDTDQAQVVNEFFRMLMRALSESADK